VAPQRQGSPSAASRRVWPISPAAPRWPPITRPSAMMPRPRPVEALTTSASRSVSGPPSSSERASTSASLATKNGASATSARYGASATPSQPAITGESRLTPLSTSTLPGRLSPTPTTGGATSASRSASRAATCGISSSGPIPTSWSRESPASSWPSRSKTPSWLRERPSATASTTPASLLNSSPPGGRPPVEASSSPASSNPAAASAWTRDTTAVRESPVITRRPERVSAWPVRTSSRSSPAVAGAADSRSVTVIFGPFATLR
jgi:hypothetical protein